MDAKEAIKLLEVVDKVIDSCPSQFEDEENTLNDFGNAMMLAISALEKIPVLEAEIARLREKETPKEPIQNIYSYSTKNDRYCPICKSWLNGRRKSDMPNFCNDCGQAIKNDKE